MRTEPEVRTLGLDDLGLIASIDRSEHVDVEFTVRDGELVERPVSMQEIPPWDPTGTGPYSVAAQIAFCRPLVANGASFFGAFDGAVPQGLAVIDASFEPSMAWLAFLYVSRPYRGRGVASALWHHAAATAKRAGARSMYVNAVPTGSAVGFYLSRGCAVAEPVHPVLYAEEPDDIHLVGAL